MKNYYLQQILKYIFYIKIFQIKVSFKSIRSIQFYSRFKLSWNVPKSQNIFIKNNKFYL